MLRQTLGHRAPLPFPSFSLYYCDVSQALSYFASTINLHEDIYILWSLPKLLGDQIKEDKSGGER
jgi:hypothetical protein